jgi:hypothetical protein
VNKIVTDRSFPLTPSTEKLPPPKVRLLVIFCETWQKTIGYKNTLASQNLWTKATEEAWRLMTTCQSPHCLSKWMLKNLTLDQTVQVVLTLFVTFTHITATTVSAYMMSVAPFAFMAITES